MKILKCSPHPIVGDASPIITEDNIYDIAYWCHGAVRKPLFAEIYGPEIELPTATGVEFARIGDRILKFGNTFSRVTQDDFEREYTIEATVDI